MKRSIGMVLAGLVFAVPAMAQPSNGFNSAWVYGINGGHNIERYNQATGHYEGKLFIAGDTDHTTLTFSYSATPGVHSPAGARLFTARVHDRSGDPNGYVDDILIFEWDSEGNLLRSCDLYDSVGGYLSTDHTTWMNMGTLRYNPVNDSLIVSANPKQKGLMPSKAWEIALPDWESGFGVATLLYTYELPVNCRNATSIDIGPDGTMYVAGYDLGYTADCANWQYKRGNLYSVPTSGVNKGVITMLVDGWLAHEEPPTGQGIWHWWQPRCPIYRELADGTPEMIVTHENVDTPAPASEWLFQPSAVGLMTFVGSAGGVIHSANWRSRGWGGQRDPVNGDVFVPGTGANTGDPNRGIMVLRPDDSAYVIDETWPISDAASPVGPLQPGACCKGCGQCQEVLEADCAGPGWVWLGEGTTCDLAHGGSCPDTLRCGDPAMDGDCDGDVDQADFALFQACYTGSETSLPEGPGICACFDRGADAPAGDSDIDAFDFDAFEACASGPGVAAASSCDDPL